MLIFVFLHFSIVSSIPCSNYVSGVKEEWECDYGCCINNGSFSVSFSEDEVCVQKNLGTQSEECTISPEFDADSLPSTPTSCPIKYNGNTRLINCGVGEICCWLDDFPEFPEFFYQIPDASSICSEQGECAGGMIKVVGSWEAKLTDLADNWDGPNEGTFCYQDCVELVSCPETPIGTPEQMCCGKEDVIKCLKTEACLKIDITSSLEILQMTSWIPVSAPLTASFCGIPGPESAARAGKLCETAGEQVLGRLGMKTRKLRGECNEVRACEGECVRAADNRTDREDEGVPWWAILLIVILLLVILLAAFFVYRTFARSSVGPDEVVRMEESDPRETRLAECRRYLKDSIAQRDMADLRLTLNLVEQEGFKRDLGREYSEAEALFQELMARREEDKRMELERSEEEARAARKRLEEAEEAVARQQEKNKQQADEAAMRLVIQARDEAKARWMRLWPRLQVRRTLAAGRITAAEKSMEKARLAREEEERLRTELEHQNRIAGNCKQLLKKAIDSNQISELESAIRQTEKETFQTTLFQKDGQFQELYSQAKEELRKLREKEISKTSEEAERQRALIESSREQLNAAVAAKDAATLEATLEETAAVQAHLQPNYTRAKALLDRLHKIERVKKSIMELKRPLIAELKSMSSPPVPVQRAMVATYLLLGEELKGLRDWGNIVILLNKSSREGIKFRVQGLKVQEVQAEVCKIAQDQIMGLTAEEVYEANQAASLFFDWAEMVCYESRQEW